MTVDEYAKAQAAITAAMVSSVLRIARLFRLVALTPAGWEDLLDLIFPAVDKARTQSAELGRQFYDSQRKLHHPDLPRHNSYAAEYRREWFSEAMFPARQAFSKPGASENDLARVALQAMKEVENGGRRTILRAVETDRVAQRWARVATGEETCEFCLTMVSRGPVYMSAESAGLDADDTTAQELWEQGDDEALDELMTRWHTGCDCKAVPVFDFKDWPGRDAFLKAEKVWEKYSRMVDNDPDLLVPQNGNQRGKNNRTWSRAEATMAAIRRALYEGELDMTDYAIAA